MLSIAFKLGKDGDRMCRLIHAPFSNPVILTDFCDKISPLCDELNKSDKLKFIGWKRLELHDRDLGARIKIKVSEGLKPSELVGIVIEALEEVYKCDIRICNEFHKEPKGIV